MGALLSQAKLEKKGVIQWEMASLNGPLYLSFTYLCCLEDGVSVRSTCNISFEHSGH